MVYCFVVTTQYLYIGTVFTPTKHTYEWQQCLPTVNSHCMNTQILRNLHMGIPSTLFGLDLPD